MNWFQRKSMHPAYEIIVGDKEKKSMDDTPRFPLIFNSSFSCDSTAQWMQTCLSLYTRLSLVKSLCLSN